MHEWALADAVAAAIVQALGERDPSSLRGAHILIGELQAVDREVFELGLRTVLEQRGVPAGNIALETQKAVLACAACSNRWAPSDAGLSPDLKEAIHFLPEAAHAFLRCPACGSADFRVEEGRGVRVASIEVAEPGDDRDE